MLKKTIIVSAAAAAALLGGAGIASAHGSGHANAHCSADDINHQSNKGHQAAGLNLSGQDAAGNVLGGQLTRAVAGCPSAGNNNHL